VCGSRDDDRPIVRSTDRERLLDRVHRRCHDTQLFLEPEAVVPQPGVGISPNGAGT